MKKRVLSLILATVLLLGLLTVPASAATPKDVYNYLKQIAMEGTHDTDEGCYYDGFVLDEENGICYAVYYWESSKNIEVCIFNDTLEVTMVLPSAMKLPYTAFITVYDDQDSTGKVSVKAGYDGSAFSSFSSFSGNTNLKPQMLNVLNELLPWVIEYTRAVIHTGGYKLKDMGLTGFTRCNVHCWDEGTVTQPPTCVDSGVKTYTCVNCGATATETIDPTGEHSWNAGEIITAPTCTEAGVKRYSCTVCGETKDESVNALGHAWTFTEVVSEPAEGESHGVGLFTCSRCGETKEAPLCAGEIFDDMPADDNWAHAPIDWAYFNGITDGVADNLFGLNQACTRAQVVTFLWRAAGEPEPSSAENPFTDVAEGTWYYKPVLWAVEKGITDGLTDTTFGPGQSCTRNQVVTFL